MRKFYLAWFTAYILLIGTGSQLDTSCAGFLGTPVWLGGTQPIVAQEESTWRRTRFGWSDSATWYRPPRRAFERRIELVHPLTLSCLVALATLAIVIWATEEDQWTSNR